MSDSRRKKLERRKRRILWRLRERQWPEQAKPMFAARNIHYELADKARGLDCGGIGAVQLLVRRVGLAPAIDAELHLLKRHLPYHESDHVLNLAYNLLCGGTCLEDLELRRNDEVYLDALGAQRIPDPTTAGDFCRRFEERDVEVLMDTINDVRVKVWQQSAAGGAEFFEEAIIEADGTMAETTGQCKAGMDINYKGQWGYHPLLVSLANTGEPLYLVNRRGSRPSHEGAAVRFDQAIALCRRAGFKRVLLRGDTDFRKFGKFGGHNTYLGSLGFGPRLFGRRDRAVRRSILHTNESDPQGLPVRVLCCTSSARSSSSHKYRRPPHARCSQPVLDDRHALIEIRSSELPILRDRISDTIRSSPVTVIGPGCLSRLEAGGTRCPWRGSGVCPRRRRIRRPRAAAGI